ncbi:MAG: diguanylate cyclase [Spirochaetales bacterium]|nr:diguanylate cyclase [Spirochaetales bacterium]
MKNLYDNDVLKLDYKTGWKWDLAEIEKMMITDNVVDLMAGHIGAMDRNVRDLLKICACIGSRFDLESISVITGKSIAEALAAITPAVDEGLVSVSGDEYKFQHDRIREAAYSLIPDDQKERIHFTIGKNVLEKTSAEELEKKLFYLTDHLNRGAGLITGKKERLELMELNFQAALKAKKAFAFAEAVEYFEKAKALFSEEEWREQPERFFELSNNLAESLFYSGTIGKAMEICAYLLEIEPDPLKRSSVYWLKTQIMDFKGESRDMILAEIRKGVKLLGVKLPEDTRIIQWQIFKNIVKMQMYLNRNSVEDLLLLPDMKDKKKIKAISLLSGAIPPAFQNNPPLYILIVLIMFNMTTSLGLTAESNVSFLNCGIIQGTILGNYDRGYRLAKAAYAFINKTKSDYLMPGTNFVFSTFISHWRVHYRESLEYFDQAVKMSLESGLLVVQLYSILHKILRLLYTGTNLDKCLTMTEEVALYCKETKASIQYRISRIITLTIRKLKKVHNNENAEEFEKEENCLIEEIKALNEVLGLVIIGQCNTMVYYFLSDLEKADKWNDFTEPFLKAGGGLFSLPDHYLFQSLILIEKWKNTKTRKQSAIMKKLLQNRKKLKLWSKHCPANFAHKYHLLCAEIAVKKNESFKSIMECYQKALNALGAGDFMHMRALIHEHQAQFWIKNGYTLIAKGFIKEAFALYKKWGASAKVKQLEVKYPVFIFETFQEMALRDSKGNAGGQDPSASGTLDSSSLDLSTIIKSSESLLSEIDMSKLLRIIMKLSIVNAGAQKGFLLLENKNDKNLYIEAGSNIDREIVILHSIPIDEELNLSSAIVKYVYKTKEPVVLHDACNEGIFTNDSYMIKNRPKSILCAPIINHGKLTGILYLENNLSKGVFTQERLNILKILSSQMAISIENAKLYENLEDKVRERTLQLDKANQKLKDLSLKDPLTNLFNRRYVYEFVSKASNLFLASHVKLANQVEKRNLDIENKVFGVYMIDIDYFKKVNDMYGHQAGDKVLITLSAILKKLIRENDTIVRWGGEEFLIILHNTRADYLKTFSRKILEVVRNISFKLNDNMVIHKTCSLGCVKMPLAANHPNLLNLEHTINLSDFALYMAKENGRNKAVHIELKNNVLLDEEIKQYLFALSQNTPINEKYILLEFVE